MIKRLLLALVVIALIAVGGVGYQYQKYVSSTPSSQHDEKIILIPKGASVGTIANLLTDAGVLSNAEHFRRYVRIKGSANQIRAGEFRFYTDLTPPQVLDVLIKGEEVQYKVTFPEGYNMRDMAKALSAIPFLSGDEFLKIVTDPDVVKSYGFTTTTLEGFLFPSTYELSRTQTEKDLVAAMVRQFKATWTPDFDAKAKSFGMDQLQVITLASIVEKETGSKDEQPTVSSVFHNRLRKGMKLESDPTIIYGLVNFDGDIKRGDIRRNHPWNTYVIPGLPITPIANPGRGAIEATLNPANTEFFYFVATGDGRHSFSKTFPEHALKVLEYQVRRRGLSSKPSDTSPPKESTSTAKP